MVSHLWIPQRTGRWSRFTRSASRGAARYFNAKRLRLANKEPIVSFTFDDVPDSAFTNGASLLDAYGVKGTFYLAPGIAGQVDENWRLISETQIAELAKAGHEIACHTHSHVKVQDLSAEELARENLLSKARLRDICGPLPLLNFAYPFGVVSLPRKLQLRQEFATCRGIYAGVNAGVVDLGLLSAFELYDRVLDESAIERLLDQTVASNGWLVFYTHDVAREPSWIGCSPKLLEMAIKAAQARGIACRSVAEALPLIGYKGAGLKVSSESAS